MLSSGRSLLFRYVGIVGLNDIFVKSLFCIEVSIFTMEAIAPRLAANCARQASAEAISP
jgi:hypothetical protein